MPENVSVTSTYFLYVVQKIQVINPHATEIYHNTITLLTVILRETNRKVLPRILLINHQVKRQNMRTQTIGNLKIKKQK